ncbi:sigma-70 family RNA polymerase sigma factor [Lysinibacillus macroides]|uniref:RNA polymerase sigma factor n=1 Tax=Lysinibacillus macroides TaxID=33935 RepID=A0A0M9DLX1_9BACI|nr:sigma-70 family RNA polymerase sigma factor [Lysinibacillus macroides]KOY82832.1 RNA polymerase sigma factor [Lysinibacillus macroides]QPR66118.1 sigma-70 family RNA polymerase sigma factor [Lysinibacillus macroides]
MESIRTEWQVRCAFNGFCKRVLKNATINTYYQRRKQQSQETTFSNLTRQEENQLYTVDNYEENEDTQTFQVAGKKITAKLLEDALLTLPDNKRIVVVLYYFLQLSDVEIGQLLQISRSTVQYRRTSSFKLLKQFLEVRTHECDD